MNIAIEQGPRAGSDRARLHSDLVEMDEAMENLIARLAVLNDRLRPDGPKVAQTEKRDADVAAMGLLPEMERLVASARASIRRVHDEIDRLEERVG